MVLGLQEVSPSLYQAMEDVVHGVGSIAGVAAVAVLE